MSIGISEVKRKEREKLQQDVTHFLEGGGTITQLPYLMSDRPKVVVQPFSLKGSRAKKGQIEEAVGD